LSATRPRSAAQIDALGGVGVTDFVAAEFGQSDDAVRTRAVLCDLAAADANLARRSAATESTDPSGTR
jgi:hypothetical protein